MPFTAQRLPGESIVLVIYEEPFDYAQDIYKIKKTVVDMAEEMEGPIFDVHDARLLHLNFSKVATALNAALSQPVLAGKTTTLGIGSGLLFSLVEKTANQRQHRSGGFFFFETPEEAIAYARKNLEQQHISETSV